MPVVRTVTGDIDARELGFTHCHEHLFVFPTSGVELADKLILDDYDKSRAELEAFRAAGGRSVVDAQPFGAGRHPELLARAARDSGVTIVAATGVHRTFYYPPDAWMYRADGEELTRLFVSEIEEGMYAYDPEPSVFRRTDIRAGIIKVGTDAEGLTPHYRKVFEAAAAAHRRTGAPIITHAELSRWGREQAEFLLERGVPPGSVIISHMDRVADLRRSLEVARSGVFLEYDTIARYRYHSDEEELELIRGMVEAGFAGNLLLGMDVTRERLPSYGGTPGLAFLSESFLPRLEECLGLDLGSRASAGEAVEAMMVANPARVLPLRR